MRLEAFIAELLYEHDCVVVPDFGGLVANYRSARLNRKSHLIQPPSKHVGFNRNLKNNDGLLTDYVAGALGVSYKEAAQRIEDCVADYHRRLQNEGRIFWEKLGIFFKDKSGQLHFIPEEQENFLLSAYGLSAVQLTPVHEEEKPQPEAEVIPIETAKRKRTGWKVAAVALPLLLAGSLLMRNQLQQNGQINFATLNPFAKAQVNARYAPAAENQLPEIAVPETNETLKNALSDSTTSTVRYDFTNQSVSEDGILIKKENVVPVKPSKEKPRVAAPVVESGQGKFAVIGGAFGVSENAEKFLAKLKADGFDAAFAGKKDGLQLVAYGFYATKAEAENAMRNIRDTDGGHAWLKSY